MGKWQGCREAQVPSHGHGHSAEPALPAGESWTLSSHIWSDGDVTSSVQNNHRTITHVPGMCLNPQARTNRQGRVPGLEVAVKAHLSASCFRNAIKEAPWLHPKSPYRQ